MTESLFSSSWYRVTGLTPRLRSHAKVHRHQYRGQTWYVLQDFSSPDREMLPFVLDQATSAVLHFVDHGLESAMTIYNQQPTP